MASRAPACARLTLAWLLAVGCGAAADPAAPLAARAWRLVNDGEVEVAWRVRTLQFYSDYECTKPVEAVPNVTGEAFATEAAEMTGADFSFMLGSPRGWETVEECAPRTCYIGFQWRELVTVRCLLFHQGEPGFHTEGLVLQAQADESSDWEDAMTWSPIENGRVKLSLACPAPPSVERGRVYGCTEDDAQSQACALTCDAGFGAVEQRISCLHGVWYKPECLLVGSLLRVVAQEPALIKPYWVVLHAVLYLAEDCTDVLRMDGVGMSSGEYVIKYANYHPKNLWDGDAGSSWASATPCTPGACYFGFRFRKPPPTIKCVKIEHPEESQYHASRVLVEQLGAGGWEELQDVTVKLLPERRQDEL